MTTVSIIIIVILVLACVMLLRTLSMSKRRAKESEASLDVEKQTVCGLNEALTVEKQRTAEFSEALRQKDMELALSRKDVEVLSHKLKEDEEQINKKNDMLMLQFEKIANDLFDKKSRQFKDTNKESLDVVLRPLKDHISEFKSRVEEIHSKDNENRGILKAELNNLMELNRRITEETTNLTSALKGNSKVQGDWGEMILDTILESSNLRKGIHYTTQTNVKDADCNNLRPDVILNLPDDKRVVIDSKVSLTAYVNYCEGESEEERKKAMTEHLRSVRNHINDLGRKSYQETVLGSPDFVIMFISVEPAFLAAVQADSELWNDAYAKKIILCSPTNLFGMLKIVDDLWKRDDLSRNANRIAEEGAKMYDKLVDFVGTLEAIGKNIDTVQGNYDKAMKQLKTGRGSLISRSQKMLDLNIKASKSMPQYMVEEAEEGALIEDE